MPGIARYSHYEMDLGMYYAPRYTTWVVMFWAAFLPLLVLLANRLQRFRRPASVILATLLCISPYLLWPSHRQGASVTVRHFNSAREAALGLVVGVHDFKITRMRLFKSTKWVYQVADDLRERDLGVFRDGKHRLMDRPHDVLFKDVVVVDGQCQVTVLRMSRFADGGGASASMLGVVAAPTTNDAEAFLVISDDAGIVRGLGTISVMTPWPFRTDQASRASRYFAYIKDFQGLKSYRFFRVDGEAAYACTMNRARRA